MMNKNGHWDLQAADRISQGLIQRMKVPGLALSVTHKGKSIFEKGYGLADLDKDISVDPQSTVFRAASISKPIAATALAIMVDESLISLEDSFYKYVPSFPAKKHDFSIRQLASHTAGIRAYRGKEYALNKPYTNRDSINIFANDPLEYKPGTDFKYNSFGWVMLSVAMEEASGTDLQTYVRTRVLEPLGMYATIPEIPGNVPKDTATFYTRYGRGFRKAAPVDNRYKLAAGGYLSTASDLSLLGNAYLNRHKILPPVSKDFIVSQWLGSRQTYYGLGWEASQLSSGYSYFGHTANGIGAFGKFLVVPSLDLVLVLLTNCSNPGIEEEINRLVSCFTYRLPS